MFLFNARMSKTRSPSGLNCFLCASVSLRLELILHWGSLRFDFRCAFRRQPSRIPTKHIAGQASNKDLPGGCRRDHVAWTLHSAEDLAALELDLHNSSCQRVIGNVLDIIAVSHYPHLILRRYE